MSSPGEPVGGPNGPRPVRTARLEAFSDGVFAIAITLLVLDLAVPLNGHTQRHLLEAIGDEWPGYLGYLVSFATVGALWLGHNGITDYLDHADTAFLRINLLLLLFISFLPFPTRLLSEYISTGRAERVASTFYGLSLLACAGLLLLLWRYALHAHLVRPDTQDKELSLLAQRLIPGMAGYVILILLGLLVPVVAVIGYLLVALYFLFTVRIHLPWPHRRPD